MYDYTRKKRGAILKQFLPLFLLAGFLLFFGKRFIRFSSPEIISPLPPQSQALIESKEELLKKISQRIKGKGTYSVYVYELNTNEKFGFGETTIFTAASVNKMPILASLYFLAGRDEIDLDKKITIQKKDIQDYGTGSIRYQPSGTQYSLKTLARLMMEKSDNTASYILGEVIIGVEKAQQLVNSWGLTQTDMENNKTSNYDMALLLSLMYRGKITNEALTKEMIGFMDDSDFEERLPKLLPQDIKVYHKIGNEVGLVHDVGIINLPHNPYYLGVFSTDVPDENEAQDLIAEISKWVFEFEKNRT